MTTFATTNITSIHKPRAVDLYRAVALMRNVTLKERGLLFVLCAHANSDGTNIFPGLQTLVEECETSESSVKRILAALREKHILLPDGKDGYLNRYRLNIPGFTPPMEMRSASGRETRSELQYPPESPTLLPPVEQTSSTPPLALFPRTATSPDPERVSSPLILPDGQSVSAVPELEVEEEDYLLPDEFPEEGEETPASQSKDVAREHCIPVITPGPNAWTPEVMVMVAGTIAGRQDYSHEEYVRALQAARAIFAMRLEHMSEQQIDRPTFEGFYRFQWETKILVKRDGNLPSLPDFARMPDLLDKGIRLYQESVVAEKRKIEAEKRPPALQEERFVTGAGRLGNLTAARLSGSPLPPLNYDPLPSKRTPRSGQSGWSKLGDLLPKEPERGRIYE